VKVKEPHPHSQAAAVMLRRMFRTHEISVWLKFRETFLAHHKAKNGTLRCHYCGKEGLVEDVPMNASKAGLSHLATIDHVVPRSKGGSEFDENNLVVACFPCNHRKGDKVLGM
jgi:5-methylcytosine-specific restriction endonuclease McrA